MCPAVYHTGIYTPVEHTWKTYTRFYFKLKSISTSVERWRWQEISVLGSLPTLVSLLHQAPPAPSPASCLPMICGAHWGGHGFSHRWKSANNEPRVHDGWPTSLPICLRFIPISESIVKPQSLLNMHPRAPAGRKKGREQKIEARRKEKGRERDQCCPEVEEWMRGTFRVTFRVLIRDRTASYLFL